MMDVEELPIDNRLMDEPVWCRYLVLVDPSSNHDKYYEVRIDLDENAAFMVTKHYGRRPWAPAKGRTEVAGVYGVFDTAQREANRIVAEKRGKGYVERERGF